MASALEKELETYRRELPKLLPDTGKFVLIQDDKVHGIWATYGDALQEGYRLFGLRPFLVKQIQVMEFTQYVTRLCAVLAIVPVLCCLGAVPVVLVIRGINQDEDRIDQRAANLKNSPPAKPPAMTREQFREKVKVGMTPDEVIAAVGKPDETSELLTQTSWFYRNKVRDALTNHIGTAMVVFQNKRVTHITF